MLSLVCDTCRNRQIVVSSRRLVLLSSVFLSVSHIVCVLLGASVISEHIMAVPLFRWTETRTREVLTERLRGYGSGRSTPGVLLRENLIIRLLFRGDFVMLGGTVL